MTEYKKDVMEVARDIIRDNLGYGAIETMNGERIVDVSIINGQIVVTTAPIQSRK